VREKTVAVAPVGCAVLAYDYWDFDCTEAAHGRALAVATAIKRVRLATWFLHIRVTAISPRSVPVKPYTPRTAGRT
jgi:pyruvate/2-oxoacid:ferredoxin oxidoreductase beta subunit